MTRWFALALLMSLPFMAGKPPQAPGQEKDAAIVLAVVKYPNLGAEILRHRGKVVLVDFWAEY